MRVAVVTTSYPHSEDDSAGHFVQTEARRLVAEGHRVSVIVPAAPHRTPEPGLELLEIPAGDGFGPGGVLLRLRESPLRMLGVARFVIQARHLLAGSQRFDRIIAHWVVPSFWPLLPRTQRPTEVVVHGSDWHLVERLPRPLTRLVLVRLLRPELCIRCVSEDLRQRVERSFDTVHLPRPAVLLVQAAGIEIPPQPSPEQLRRKLGIEARPLVVVVGRLIPEKRTEVTLSALELLEDVETVVLGDGPLRESLERRFPKARFLGHRPRTETLEWIAAADLLMTASRNEGYSTVVREARVLGTPVVATSSGDLLTLAKSDPDLLVVP